MPPISKSLNFLTSKLDKSPKVIKFSKPDLICPFCKNTQQKQDLWDHSLECTKYGEALTQSICPLCNIGVDGAMTTHLHTCRFSSEYFQLVFESKNGKLKNCSILPILWKTNAFTQN